MTFIEQLKTHTKAWEEFKRWYLKDYMQTDIDFAIEMFESLKFEMQSGVFIAFLESKNFDLTLGSRYYRVMMTPVNDLDLEVENEKSLIDNSKEAILKAFEILNS